jgi:CRP-like cAMP-binding protein
MDYIVLLGEEQENSFAEKVEVLAKASFLQHCERREVQLLSYFMEQKEYLRRSVIALQGLPSNYMYIVFSGECAIVQHASAELPETVKQDMEENFHDGDAGNAINVFGEGPSTRSRFESESSMDDRGDSYYSEEDPVSRDLSNRFNIANSCDIEVVLLGPGQYFGEREMLKGIPYEYSLVAMSQCKILRMHRDDCFSQMDSQTLGVLSTMAAERHTYFAQRMLYLTDPKRNVNFQSKELNRPRTPPDRTTLVESEMAKVFRVELERHKLEVISPSNSNTMPRPLSPVRARSPPTAVRVRSPIKLVTSSDHRTMRGTFFLLCPTALNF